MFDDNRNFEKKKTEKILQMLFAVRFRPNILAHLTRNKIQILWRRVKRDVFSEMTQFFIYYHELDFVYLLGEVRLPRKLE